MVSKKSVKKKVEKKKKVVKKPVKRKKPVKKLSVKLLELKPKKGKIKIGNGVGLISISHDSIGKCLDEISKFKEEASKSLGIQKEEKVYKWVSIIFHSLPWISEGKVERAANLGAVPVSREKYNNNKEMFDKLFSSEINDGLELEKDDNVCKISKNEDGTINKVVLFEFPKKNLDEEIKRYNDSVDSLEGLQINRKYRNLDSFFPDYDEEKVYSAVINKFGDGSFVNPSLQNHIEEFDKIIGPVEDPAELAALMRDKNSEEWERRKEDYLASKIDNHEIDYLGEHSTFKALANKYLDKDQKEIADLMKMSRFRYLLNWIEDILQSVNSYGFYARGTIKVEGYVPLRISPYEKV